MTALWLVSLLAAAGFTATGYFLARFRAEEKSASPTVAEEDEDTSRREPMRPPEEVRADETAASKEVVPSTPPPPATLLRGLPLNSSKPPIKRTDDEEDEHEMETPIPAPPETLPLFSAGPKIPTPIPPRDYDPDPLKTKPPPPPTREAAQLLDSGRYRDARGEDEEADFEPNGSSDVTALQRELRSETSARREAEKRATDLMSRLVSSSQQITALRAKLGLADEAVRRPGSIPPPGARSSDKPTPQRLQSLAPGLFAEIEDLRREVERLRSENETLRVAAFIKK